MRDIQFSIKNSIVLTDQMTYDLIIIALEINIFTAGQ